MRNLKCMFLPFLYSFQVSKSLFMTQEDHWLTYSNIYGNSKKKYQLNKNTLIFSGNSNKKLAQEVADCFGVNLGKVILERFQDGECNIQLLETVRGRHVYIIQSTCPPVNENLVELFLFVSALRRASVKTITVIVPYYGYSRQDHKLAKTQSISAADIAKLLEFSGIDHLISIDLHRSQIQGAFSPQVPVDNICPYITLINHMNNHPLKLTPPNELTLVSPDFNGVSRAKRVQDVLRIYFPNLKTSITYFKLGLAMIYKSKYQDSTSELSLVGDVFGKNCLIVDDIVDSATTLKNAADILKKEGAAQVMAYATHPILSSKASLKIGISELSKVYFTDTIQMDELDKSILSDKLTILSVAPLIAETIHRLQEKQSLHELHSF